MAGQDDDPLDALLRPGSGFADEADLSGFFGGKSPRPDEHLWAMEKALAEAEIAYRADEAPVGAVVLYDGRIIATGHNQRESLHDPTAHAEMLAITAAAAELQSWRLEDCTLVVTLEPCPMCAGAILNARIPQVVYGATDPKAGAVESLYRLLDDTRLNHRCRVTSGVLAERCGEILTRFFREKRRLGRK